MINQSPSPGTETDEEENGPSPAKQREILERLAAGVFLAWVVFGLGPIKYFGAPDGAGTFGDTFGAVNSLFSGMAFAGLIYTIWLQRQELALQRRELRLTRKEMEASTIAQNSSATALNRQVRLAANAARMNGMAALLQQADNEVNLLRERMSRQSSSSNPAHQIMAEMHRPDLERARGRRTQLIADIESLSASMKSDAEEITLSSEGGTS